MIATLGTQRVSTAQVAPLRTDHSEEALTFLRDRPLHTVIMAGLLREHGPSIPAPRGDFYSCRSANGELEGVALVGRATMFEARSQAALKAFAKLAKRTSSVQMIMGEEDDLNEFLQYYNLNPRSPRLFCRELFYKFVQKETSIPSLDNLRQATLEDLNQVIEAHAEMVESETGVNPLTADAEGFCRRCTARVEKGRVWTLFERGELIFKADIVAETPEAAYLEGVWVNPRRRREGYGRRCWSELSRALLKKWPSFCGFVNAANPAAHSFYERMGGTFLARYGKVYL